MKHLLLPIDGSERSIRSVELIKELFSPEQIDVTLIAVRENNETILSKYDMEEAKKELMPRLNEVADILPGFQVKKHVSFGRAGQSIIEYAENHGIDTIVITKSTHSALSVFIGSVAVYVVKYAKCVVMIAPEKAKKK